MAVNFDRDPTEKKASSLSDDGLTPLSRTVSVSGKRGKEKQKDQSLKKGKTLSLRGLIVDLVLLLVLVGVVVGGWLGYRAVKSAYAPDWQSRQVSFSVEIKNIDYDRADQLLPSLAGHDLWYSAHVSGDRLGVVKDVRAVPSVTEDGRETMTLYLTVETTVAYRAGVGYYVGTTRILAGETGVFRAQGMTAEGMVVSLTDLTEAAQ